MKKMKKVFKVIGIILGILIILGLIFFIIDYNRVENNERPIFCIENPAHIMDGGTAEFFGLGYKVIDFHTISGFDYIKIGTWFMKYEDFEKEIEENINQQPESNLKYKSLEDVTIDYDLADMIDDKCYIVMNSNTVYHIEELYNFIKNVENNIADEIRIVEYTKEDQPILTNLEYRNNKFILKVDNRRDGYANKRNKKITIKEYDATKYELVKENKPKVITDLKTYYPLKLKEIKGIKSVKICNYVTVKETTKYNFQLEFNKDLEKEEITKILAKGENNKYNYNIYSYKGTVNIIVNGEKMSLHDALINNKITIDEILEKADKEAKESNTIYGDIYADGGSRFYIYNDYSILKLNKLEGNKDLYIGVPSMNINDIYNL